MKTQSPLATEDARGDWFWRAVWSAYFVTLPGSFESGAGVSKR